MGTTTKKKKSLLLLVPLMAEKITSRNIKFFMALTVFLAVSLFTFFFF